MNDYVQTPEHPTNFYKTLLAKNFDDTLKVSLIGDKLVEIRSTSDGDVRTERKIESRDELRSIILDKFQLRIDFDDFQPKDEYNLEMELKRLKLLKQDTD